MDNTRRPHAEEIEAQLYDADPDGQRPSEDGHYWVKWLGRSRPEDPWRPVQLVGESWGPDTPPFLYRPLNKAWLWGPAIAMPAETEAAGEPQVAKLFGLLDAMVQRWPELGHSTGNISDLANALGVEVWTRSNRRDDDEMRLRGCPDGLDLDPGSILGDDTSGWERMGE